MKILMQNDILHTSVSGATGTVGGWLGVLLSERLTMYGCKVVGLISNVERNERNCVVLLAMVQSNISGEIPCVYLVWKCKQSYFNHFQISNNKSYEIIRTIIDLKIFSTSRWPFAEQCITRPQRCRIVRIHWSTKQLKDLVILDMMRDMIPGNLVLNNCSTDWTISISSRTGISFCNIINKQIKVCL